MRSTLRSQIMNMHCRVLVVLFSGFVLLVCADEQADTAEVDAVGSTAFLVNAERALAGGFVPSFANVSEKGKQYIQEWNQIRKKVPPLYFDGFSPLMFNEYTWQIWESFLKYDTFDKMDDRSMMMGLRTVFLDSQVKQAAALGTRQVVYLGSGLDTKSVRLHSPAVSSFEVDQKPVLLYKTKKLAAGGFPVYPAKLIFGNYFEIDLFAELEKAGLDMAAPTLVVWEGNSAYIPIDMSVTLLSKLFEKIPKATVAFDSFAAEGDENLEKIFQAMYDVMNSGKNMLPGRTDPQTLAAKVGAKLLHTIRMKEFLVQTLGSEDVLNSYVLNNADRMSAVKSLGEVLHFNVIAKAGHGEL